MIGVKRSGFVLAEALVALGLFIGIVFPSGQKLYQTQLTAFRLQQACNQAQRRYLKAEEEWQAKNAQR